MQEAEIVTTSQVEDFSLINLFFAADIVVKAVMVILMIASLWSWAVIIEKWITIGGAKHKAKKFEDAYWSGRGDVVDGGPGSEGGNAMSRIYSAASREFAAARMNVHGEREALLERANRAMKATIDREVGKASAGLGVLATVGSASPFIGLFGTVWGIMNSFRAIADQQSTNLAVVAPGIAEALFATALGLVAAIPAVIFYNKLTSDANQYADQMDVFSEEVLVRMSRKLSEQGG